MTQAKLLSTVLHEGPVVAMEIHHPDPFHLGQLGSGQGMRADAAAEIKVVSVSDFPLQAQGVADVIATAQVPGRQLMRVAVAHLILVKLLSLFRSQGTRVSGCHRFGAVRQALVELFSTEPQKTGQLLPQSKAITAEGLQHFGLGRCHGRRC